MSTDSEVCWTCNGCGTEFITKPEGAAPPCSMDYCSRECLDASEVEEALSAPDTPKLHILARSGKLTDKTVNKIREFLAHNKIHYTQVVRIGNDTVVIAPSDDPEHGDEAYTVEIP